MNCTLGRIDCKFEFQLKPIVVAQAFRNAGLYSVETPVARREFGVSIPDWSRSDRAPMPLYPYVWHPDPDNKTIRLEMGRVGETRRLVALFTFKADPNIARGSLVHLAVFFVPTDKTFTDLTPDFFAVPSIDTRHHRDAFEFFKGALLRVDTGQVGYTVNVPETPPPVLSDDE